MREAPDPVAGPGEVRIRTEASGVNFADLLARMGLYLDAPRPPCVIGFEVSGVVDQVGEDVGGFRVGDRVFAAPRFGGYMDTVVVRAEYVFPIPQRMSFEEAAAFPCVYLTAHHVMLFSGPLREGSTVFVHSAAGGVGLAAVQLARSRSCVVVGTASPSKHEFLREQGCQHPIDYERWPESVRRIVGDRGIDLAIDPIGGRSWRESYRLLAPGGRMVCLGASMNAPGKRRNPLAVARFFLQQPRFSPMQLMGDNKQVMGFNMGRLFHQFEVFRPELEALLRMYEDGGIKPYVDRTFGFEEAPAAHHWLHERRAKGKVLLVPHTRPSS